MTVPLFAVFDDAYSAAKRKKYAFLAEDGVKTAIWSQFGHNSLL
jgi:hypothetical protein